MVSQVEQMLRDACAPLPEEAVGKGARWEKLSTLRAKNGNATQTDTYTLGELHGDKGKLDDNLGADGIPHSPSVGGERLPGGGGARRLAPHVGAGQVPHRPWPPRRGLPVRRNDVDGAHRPEQPHEHGHAPGDHRPGDDTVSPGNVEFVQVVVLMTVVPGFVAAIVRLDERRLRGIRLERAWTPVTRDAAIFAPWLLLGMPQLWLPGLAGLVHPHARMAVGARGAGLLAWAAALLAVSDGLARFWGEATIEWPSRL